MKICGTDAEWKREMLSLGKLNSASSDHDDTCVYTHHACHKKRLASQAKTIWEDKNGMIRSVYGRVLV